jgi:hypothetical protein
MCHVQSHWSRHLHRSYTLFALYADVDVEVEVEVEVDVVVVVVEVGNDDIDY